MTAISPTPAGDPGTLTPIRTLLVANRGEIARRIMRTARAMGIATAAVYSDADADSPHVAEADMAVRLPGVTPADTYLRSALILDAASRVQDGSGVVLLTDMFGGTPSNLAISAMEGGRIEVICGINLPMLIKLATLRDNSELDHAVIEARDAGRKYITVASKVLMGK